MSHHGQAISNSPALVHALHPRAAIINNGTRKGGQPDAMRVLFSSPGLEDVWQMHFSLLSGQEYTVPGAFIANQIDQPGDAMPIGTWTPPLPGQQAPPAPAHNGKSSYFKIVAQQDGTFTVIEHAQQLQQDVSPAAPTANADEVSVMKREQLIAYRRWRPPWRRRCSRRIARARPLTIYVIDVGRRQCHALRVAIRRVAADGHRQCRRRGRAARCRTHHGSRQGCRR